MRHALQFSSRDTGVCFPKRIDPAGRSPRRERIFKGLVLATMIRYPRLFSGVLHKLSLQGRGVFSAGPFALALAVAAVALVGSSGCSSYDPITKEQAQPYTPPATITIKEGDVLSITFPGTQGLDTQQEVRRDGRISLAIVGEVVAAGRTPGELADELARLYSAQLISKEVNVNVVSSALEVFVTGAVLHPGKIISKRPLTAFEAVMEAGGFSDKADMRKVVVVRTENGRVRNFRMNLADVVQGNAPEPFYLKPFDVVMVGTRVVWF